MLVDAFFNQEFDEAIGVSSESRHAVQKSRTNPFQAIEHVYGSEISQHLVSSAKKAYFNVLCDHSLEFYDVDGRRNAARKNAHEKMESLLSDGGYEPLLDMFKVRRYKSRLGEILFAHFSQEEQYKHQNTDKNGRLVAKPVRGQNIGSAMTSGFAKEAAASAADNTSATSGGREARRTVTARTGRAPVRNTSDRGGSHGDCIWNVV